MIRWLLLLILPIILLLSQLLIGSDTIYVLSWWASILVVGLIFLPITSKIFSKFFDKGYLFSKIIGLAFLTFTLWFFSSLKILPFYTITVYFLLIAAIVIIYIFLKGFTSFIALFKDLSTHKAFIYEEALFLLCLVLFAFVKGHNPASGVESRMDFAFLNNLLNTKFMPPVDIWFGGKPLNYYFYGQYIFAFLTRICNIDSAITYNLAYISLFAFGFTLTFSLTANMVYLLGKQKMKTVILAGLISACLLSLGGNLHTIIYAGILPEAKLHGLYNDAVGKVDREYFYADPRSFIGTNPEVGDSTITEFPAYSLILGDLHAQIIDIIFVLTFLALLLALLFNFKNRHIKPGPIVPSKYARNNPKTAQNTTKWYQLPIEYWFVILLLPILFMTNTWDFPIYVVVAGSVILCGYLKNNDFKLESLVFTVIDIVKIVLVSIFLLFFFLINFFDPTEGIKFTNPQHLFSALYLFKLFVIWGFQIFFVILFIVYLSHTEPKYALQQVTYSPAPLENKKIESIAKRLIRFLSDMTLSDAFVLILSVCAIGLIIISELVYQKDASGDKYARSNTVWKVTLQAFLMFDVVIGYISVRIFMVKRSIVKKLILGIVVGSILCSVMMFAFYGLGQPYLGLVVQPIVLQNGSIQFPLKSTSPYISLDFNKDFKLNFADDYNVIKWLKNKEVGNQPVIVEANGDSYSDYGRFSIHTGFPTIMGWYVHEWYWRGSKNTSDRDMHVADVSTIYTSANTSNIIPILKKYHVKYIVLGKLERDKFTNLIQTTIMSVGSVIYQSGTTQLIKVNQALLE